MVNKPDTIRKSILGRGKPPKPEPEEEDKDNSIRINIRVSPENLAYIKREARDTGSNVSAICGIAVNDWVLRRQSERKRLEAKYDINELMRNPEFVQDLVRHMELDKK